MRIFLIILRVGVFALAMLGTAASGYLGYRWYSDASSQQTKLDLTRRTLVAWEVLNKAGQAGPNAGNDIQSFKTQLETLNPVLRAIPFLLAGAVLGLLGGILALAGRTTSAAVVLIVAGAGPGVLAPRSLVFTSILILAGFAALFVSFLAWVARPKDRAGEEEDEDERRAGRRRGRDEEDEDEEDRPAKAGGKRMSEEVFEADQEVTDRPSRGKKHEDAFEEDEEPAPAKAGGKRKDRFEDEDEDEEPPVRAGKRKRS
jgi:hypothetical protein